MFRTTVSHSERRGVYSKLRSNLFSDYSVKLGIAKSNRSYTCPILEIHTWRKELIQTSLKRTGPSPSKLLSTIDRLNVINLIMTDHFNKVFQRN